MVISIDFKKKEEKRLKLNCPFNLLSLFSAITKEEENYEEAVKAINSCFGGGKPTTRLQEILNDPACNQLTKEVWFHFVSSWVKDIAIRKLNVLEFPF